MAINETISKGNKYRRLKDATNKVWQRISFWTAASDVEFNSGSTLESSLGNVTGITDSLTSTSSTVAASAAAVASLNSKITSFQTGVNSLYNAFVAKGVTPSAKTLAAMASAVNAVYNAGANNASITSSNIKYAMWQSNWDSVYYDTDNQLPVISAKGLAYNGNTATLTKGRYLIIISVATIYCGRGLNPIIMETELDSKCVFKNAEGTVHVFVQDVASDTMCFAYADGYSGGRTVNETVTAIRLGDI